MQRLGDRFARCARRYLPDPLVLACLLTLLVLLAALAFPRTESLKEASPGARSLSIVSMWLLAVWNAKFLTFALQMCMVLLTGYGLARAPVALRGLKALAGVARSNSQAVVLLALTSCVGCWINWGLGLILAGVLAIEMRRQLDRQGVYCQYALIVAAAYAGMMIWHGGFSGSAPLKVASDGVLIEVGGVGAAVEQVAPIPITRTILAPANLVLTAVLIVGIPLALRMMGVRRGTVGGTVAGAIGEEAPGGGGSAATGKEVESASFAERINNTRLVPLVIALLVFVALGHRLWEKRGGAVGLDFVNSAFLGLGLLLHGNLLSYMRAVTEGGKAIVGIVIQFPLYSGIQGVMFGAGLAASVSQWAVESSQLAADWLHISVGHTFPLATFLSAGVVNFFVPSGGGQWIVQGPIMCGAAKVLSVPYEQTVMAIAYGDQLTNMVQPFWAIPLMGLTRVDAREFMGYCALLMLLAAPVFAVALLMF